MRDHSGLISNDSMERNYNRNCGRLPEGMQTRSAKPNVTNPDKKKPEFTPPAQNQKKRIDNDSRSTTKLADNRHRIDSRDSSNGLIF